MLFPAGANRVHREIVERSRGELHSMDERQSGGERRRDPARPTEDRRQRRLPKLRTQPGTEHTHRRTVKPDVVLLMKR